MIDWIFSLLAEPPNAAPLPLAETPAADVLIATVCWVAVAALAAAAFILTNGGE